MSPHTHIFAHGKLLLAGEYFVLDGATALAVPTRLGQHFDIRNSPDWPSEILWTSFTHDGKEWFRARLAGDLELLDTTSPELGERLRRIFLEAQKLGAIFPQGHIAVVSRLDFPRNWGLGTSATLIHSLAKWLRVDAYSLLAKTFGGSGYDLACAESQTPIFYQVKDSTPNWQPVLFAPPFREKIGFIHLGQKQNSRDGIRTYRQKGHVDAGRLQEISFLAKALSHQDTVEAFIQIIEQLEQHTGDWIQQTPIKPRRFADFEGGIKSLGAWGGDFIMAVSPNGQSYIRQYFFRKGLDTFVTYDEMILPIDGV